MQPIASSHLRGLQSHFLSETLQASRQLRAFTESDEEIFSCKPETTAPYLHDHTRGTATKSCRKRDPNEAFSAAQPHFYALSIGRNAQNGCQALIQKEGKFYGLCNLVQHRGCWQRDKLQFGKDRCVLMVRQSQQDFVVHLPAMDVSRDRTND